MGYALGQGFGTGLGTRGPVRRGVTYKPGRDLYGHSCPGCAPPRRSEAELGTLLKVGSAGAAAAWAGCAEGVVAAVAVLQGVPYGRRRSGGRRTERRRGRELAREAVGQEGGGSSYALGWQVGGQGPAYD